METPRSPRKPGPVPGPATRSYVVLLEERYAEWGKRQRGGLSLLVRRLLTEAYERQTQQSRQDEDAS